MGDRPMPKKSHSKKARKTVKKQELIVKPEIIDAPSQGVVIDHHTELEIHFEEYEMSRAPGS